jgi:D-mannonate dehydratase
MDSEEIDSIVEEAAANHNENSSEKWSDEEIERLKKEIKELGIIDISV